jgi:hypothetical protein
MAPQKGWRLLFFFVVLVLHYALKSEAQPFSSNFTWLSGLNGSTAYNNDSHINSRGGAQLVQHPTNASLRVVFGGTTFSHFQASNTFTYDVTTDQWRYLEGSNVTEDSGGGLRPGARSFHCTGK